MSALYWYGHPVTAVLEYCLEGNVAIARVEVEGRADPVWAFASALEVFA